MSVRRLRDRARLHQREDLVELSPVAQLLDASHELFPPQPLLAVARGLPVVPGVAVPRLGAEFESEARRVGHERGIAERGGIGPVLLLHGCPSGRRAVRLRRVMWENLARGCPGGFAQGPRGRRRAPRVGVPRTIPSPLPARSSLARDADHLIGRRGGLLAGFFLARARLRARFPLAIARDGICRRARTYIARMGRVHRGATPGGTSGPRAGRQIAVRPRVPRVERAPSRDGARATGR